MEKEAQDYLSEPDLWSGLKLREANLRNVRNELRKSGLSGEYRESLEQSFEKINEDISLFETALGSYLPRMTKRRANKHKQRRSKSLRNRGKMSILVSSFQRIYSLAGGDARTRVLRLTALTLVVAIVIPPVAQELPLYRTGRSSNYAEHSASQGVIKFMWLLRVFATNDVMNRKIKTSDLSGVYMDRMHIHYPYLCLELLVILTVGLLLAYSFPRAGENRQGINEPPPIPVFSEFEPKEPDSKIDDEIVSCKCPKCGSNVRIPRKHLGKRGRCSQCEEIFEAVLPE